MWVKDILAQWEHGVGVGDACHDYEVELAYVALGVTWSIGGRMGN